jgi:hypothetical protein
VHTDEHAKRMSQAVAAQAFTHGSDIYYGAGHSPTDVDLTAHELGHVVEQVAAHSSPPPNQVQRQPEPVAPAKEPAPSEQPAQAPPAPDDPNQESVDTSWYVDFRGAGQYGPKERVTAAHGERTSTDVLLVNYFEVGPAADRKRHVVWEKQGNALPYQSAHVGEYLHPKGRGEASGSVQYAARRDINIRLKWGVTPAAADRSKASAANDAVQRYVASEVANPRPGGALGDWEIIRTEAEKLADSQLPGHSPSVEVSYRNESRNYPLPPVQYEVRKPATATGIITVPTKDMAVSGTDVSETSRAAQSSRTDTSHVDVQAGASKSQSGTQSQGSIDVQSKGSSTTTTTSQSKKTYTETKYGITIEDIKREATSITEHIFQTWDYCWELMIGKLPPAPKGPVEQEGKERSFAGKAWDWIKDKASDVWNWGTGKLVDWGKNVLKKQLMGWIKKLVGAEFWWFTIVDYGLGWLLGKLGDKVKGKLTINRGPDEKKNNPDPHDNYRPGLFDMRQVYSIATNRQYLDNVQRFTERDIKASFEKTVKEEDESATRTTKSSSSQGVTGKASGSSTSTSSGSRVDVQAGGSTVQQGGAAEAEAVTRTRTYSTTIKVAAGQPVLAVKIEEK